MRKPFHGLGTLQSEVMELIWGHGEATVAQLFDTIGARRSITYTTILSAVQKLEKKDWLKHRVAGRAHVYYAVRDRLQVGSRSLRDLLRTAFSGDPRLLLASLLEDTKLSDMDLKELRKLIEERRKEVRNE
ncbi:MAG TPA: BlaI/MecI/CopY family transcriptional regulator [Pirellulales bacterium]|jgi:predicted transcriptional regulator|nr:BlaI/MecI/CopY family transcriptional regulator [Pirellulales bacterium]